MSVSDIRETGEQNDIFYRQVSIHRKIFTILNIFMSYGGEAGRLTGSICSGSGSIARVTSFDPESRVRNVISL